MAACLRPPHIASRTPSIGLMQNLAASPTSFALLVQSRARAPHPFTRREPALLVHERAAASPYPAPSWIASRLTSTAPGRCFSPISATDIPTRAHVSRPTPAPAACAAMSASDDELRALAPRHSESGVRPPCDNPTPGGAALDGAPPASDESPSSLLDSIKRRRRAPRAGEASLAWRCQPRRGPVIRPLTPPVAPRAAPIAEGPQSARTASTARASTRAASPIRGAFHRQVLPHAFAEGARHRSRSFAAVSRLPARFRSPRLLSQGGARSQRW